MTLWSLLELIKYSLIFIYEKNLNYIKTYKHSKSEKNLDQNFLKTKLEKEFSLIDKEESDQQNITKMFKKCKSSNSLNLLDESSLKTLSCKNLPEYLHKIKHFEDMGLKKYDGIDWKKIIDFEFFKERYNMSLKKYFKNAKKIFELIEFHLLFEHEDFRDKKIYLPPKQKKHLNMKTLILDLDETLIHSDMNLKYNNHDHTLKVPQDKTGESVIPIFFRPGLTEFLNFASQHFELGIFTAATQNYADIVINHLDPNNNIFSFRLYRNSCINIKSKLNLKPISLIENRKLEDIIIVDNNIGSFCSSIKNGYLIPDFFTDKNDCELQILEVFLREKVGVY